MRSIAPIALGLLAGYGFSAAQQGPSAKKLIEYGWDVPTPAFVAEHLRDMEQRPFDGLIMRMAVGGQVFTPSKWTEVQLQPDLDALARLEWGQFTDNFLMMYAASEVDWFDDGQWEAVVHNVRATARAAKAGHCVGVCFDAEPYGANPWHYEAQARAKDRSFAEYQAQYRLRGAQFMNAVQAEMPEPVVHTFFLFGVVAATQIDDLAEREKRLAQEHYGLYPAFINGMLDAMQPGTVLTDGNEGSYYYQSPLAYYQAYHSIRQRALTMVAPENGAKYRSQVQVAQALYVDYVFGKWPHPTPAEHLTDEERARWFEHNVYYALTTSDRYVWLYSEKMNWWKDEDLPSGLAEATRSGREKAQARRPLGFDIEPMMQAARDRQKAKVQAQLKRRSAALPRLTGAAPAIDAELGDEAWKSAQPLEPLQLYLDKPGTPVAATDVRAVYDEQALYLAARCTEPKVDALKLVGAKRDDDVWLGDSVDLFLEPAAQAPVYYHFILNPRNVLWDARAGEEQDLAYSPQLATAARIGAGEWTLEMAIPWSALNMAPPRAGDTCRANVCRQRLAEPEQSTWSQTVGGFVEPESFGTWTFR
jgi:hypothetical protein